MSQHHYSPVQTLDPFLLPPPPGLDAPPDLYERIFQKMRHDNGYAPAYHYQPQAQIPNNTHHDARGSYATVAYSDNMHHDFGRGSYGSVAYSETDYYDSTYGNSHHNTALNYGYGYQDDINNHNHDLMLNLNQGNHSFRNETVYSDANHARYLNHNGRPGTLNRSKGFGNSRVSIFCEKWTLDNEARRVLETLSEGKQKRIIETFNPERNFREKESDSISKIQKINSKIFMSYVRRFRG